ncbi:MAG: TetR/AcrR family transcriptional regulator [Methylophilaceae bacterium]|nr:TetR/AcrR family transcriptional regulator [Methylophilaceae bacterium]
MAQLIIEGNVLTIAVFETFRKHGYDGTTITLLSKVAGLKKSSLYHHFPKGKAGMAKTVATYMQTQIQQGGIMPLLNKAIAPEERFKQIITTLQAFYADGAKSCLLNVLSLGDVAPDLKQVLSTIYNTLLYALEKLVQKIGMNSHEAKLWSERFLIFLQGALVIQHLTKNEEIFTL